MSIYFSTPNHNDGYLNNLYPCPFTVEGRQFLNSEHYFMWKKVMMFEPELEQLILSTKDAKEMKKIALNIKNYKDAEWISKRYDIMKEALYHKFSQNPKLLNNLLWTGNSVIVYADSKDKIWGIGITAVEALMNVPWEGENLLGEALIETRSRFKNI
jgi:ribA/ribD-fused uncharacterized protein